MGLKMKMHPDQKAFVLLSGGQDSFVCLLWALDNFSKVEAVTIKYGQSHEKETEYAKKTVTELKVDHTIYDIGTFISSISDSSLFEKNSHNTQHKILKKLPASFVPNRNGIFLTIIANHAFRQSLNHIHIVTGTCETDFSGYPDCRDNYMKAKQLELSLGLDIPVTIHTPLMWKNKAETFKMADDSGRLKELITNTLTCYKGNETLHDWGRGCGECPACRLRKKGYEEFLLLKD